MKRLTDLQNYTSTLPDDSELFGVYQPLIGWTSERQTERVARGFANDLKRATRGLLAKITPEFDAQVFEADRFVEVTDLRPGAVLIDRVRGTGTFIGDAIARDLPADEPADVAVWDLIEEERLHEIMKAEVVPEIIQWQSNRVDAQRAAATPLAATVGEQLKRESTLAAYLLHLKEAGQFDALKSVFYKKDLDTVRLLNLIKLRDPLDVVDPTKQIDRATLSPLGIVHLYRQYFFELDTFLGSPAGHVWLSPGSTVELVEVSTRRTLTERTTELETATVTKTESATTTEEELSEAVKKENRSDTKFGMNSTVNQGWIGGSATASASLNLDTTQTTARENNHRRMRQQTEKLSTEIRKNVKSTIRTVIETTDMSSKRYLLHNKTDDLVNYELRRKMRQVGVQVQDVGTYLCWQTYVDDPGRDLGIAKLVHIAKDAEIGHIPPPEKIPMPDDYTSDHAIDIPFVPRTEDTEPDEDMDEAYRDGVEVNTDTNEGTPEKVQWQFPGITATCDKANFQYAGIDFDYGGNDVIIEVVGLTETAPGSIRFDIWLRHVNFRNNPNLRVTAKIRWTASETYRAEIADKEKESVSAYNELTAREFKKAYVEAAQDRITKASRIRPRDFEDLREEERIVVYRALIQGMLTRGIPMPDDRTRHVVSELLNTIFDIDKMLYFVAPEWWRPRLHRSHQVLGGEPPKKAPGATAKSAGSINLKGALYSEVFSSKIAGTLNGVSYAKAAAAAAASEDTSIPATSQVSWGGAGEGRADNYYITDESDPARLGSSLGWLLQLDGDDLRNAFLNAPWVKAVIPVRPGKEKAAINWLSQVGVEGSEGLNNAYVAPTDELAEIPHAGEAPTLREAIDHLCTAVAAKHRAANVPKSFPTAEINDDNTVRATPLDKVYEHGFYPLQGGFRANVGEDSEVFDQWIEVVPTDQIVPVEVAYDPKTGRLL